MYVETNRRSLIKGISWRFVATSTTILIVYIFFGRLDLAIIAGALETVAKIFLYYLHERGWNKIRFGKKRIQPFNLWITGLPLSGKVELAEKVYNKLESLNMPIDLIENHEVRKVLPEIGYEKEQRVLHVKRIGHLVCQLQKHSVSTICCFVAPYTESRQAVREMTENYVEVYVEMDAEECRKKQFKELDATIYNERLKDLERTAPIYEAPTNADIVISKDENLDEAADRIVSHLKKAVTLV